MKDQAFKQLNAVIRSMNFDSFVRDLENLEQSRDFLRKHYEVLEQAFNNNLFSQIAQRQRHYRSYIESLEVLNAQSQNLRELAESKYEHIKVTSQDLKTLRDRMDEAIAQIAKVNSKLDLDLGKEQEKESNSTQMMSPFLLYVKEREQVTKAKYPSLSYLEIVALIQSEWVKEDQQRRQ